MSVFEIVYFESGLQRCKVFCDDVSSAIDRARDKGVVAWKIISVTMLPKGEEE